MAEWTWDETKLAWRKDLWIKGRRRKLTFRGPKREAQEYEARRRIELGASPVVTTQTSPEFESFCVDVYKPHAKAKLRASTWGVRRYQLLPLIAFFKRTRLTKVTEPLVEEYKQLRLKSVAKVTVNDELKVLKVVLAYARHLHLPCSVPVIRGFAVRRKKGTAKAYTREEVSLLLTAAGSIAPDFFALVKFLVETGCRKSEAINLPWARVDFRRGLVRIWSDVEDDDEYEVKSSDREVTLSDGLVRVLKEQKARVGGSEWVFPVRTDRQALSKGDKYATWPKRTWYRVVALAGLEGGPHRLRHTFASLFLEQKPDLFALSRILGHSHTRVTELYSHLLPDHLATTRNVVVFENHPRDHPQKVTES